MYACIYTIFASTHVWHLRTLVISFENEYSWNFFFCELIFIFPFLNYSKIFFFFYYFLVHSIYICISAIFFFHICSCVYRTHKKGIWQRIPSFVTAIFAGWLITCTKTLSRQVAHAVRPQSVCIADALSRCVRRNSNVSIYTYTYKNIYTYIYAFLVCRFMHLKVCNKRE